MPRPPRPGAGALRCARLALACGSALLASACALLLPGPTDLPLPTGLPAATELSRVPFFAQDQFQCGPATLAMALSYAGAPRTPQQLEPQVYLPERHGALQPEMLAATRRAGRIAYPLRPALGDVLQEVAAGHPVIVLQNLGWELFPQWHYALVVGYALDPGQVTGQVIMRSGTQERLAMDRRAFQRSWERAGRWAFVALPPDTLPATAREDDYVSAAADLERTDPPAAAVAYGTALARWPVNLVARIGLGNIAYGSGRAGDAERDYRQATREHPESGDAWNNLAQVLHEAGRDAEARAAADRAIAIGGERAAAYRATRDAMETAPAR